MSTLTKVLIVLVSIFAVFLCGIVSTYVATAENYKQRADENNRKWQSARNTQESAERAKEEADKTIEEIKKDLGAKLAERDTQITRLRTDLENAKRENASLVQQGASLAATAQATSAGEKEQRALFQSENRKVQALEAQRIGNEKELEELNRALLEKVTLLAQHEDTIRRLTQENQDLGTRLNQNLVQYGRVAAQPPTTVAPGTPLARPVQPIAAVVPPTKGLALNGQITMVDTRSRLAEISIGAAAGVRQDMTFHVIRGERFVANILILEVWPDKAVGILDLVQAGMQPQAGDRVATNL